MAVQTTKTNKPFNPRGNDQSPKGYNRASLFSGKALDFDGVNDYVDAGTLDITGYTAISFAGYIKIDDFNSTQLVLSILHSNTDDIRIVVQTGYLEIGVDDGTYYRLLVDVNLNEWYFVNLTFDGSLLKAYINGQEAGSMAASFDFTTGSGAINLGQRVGGGFPYDGQIAGTKIFNTALTAAQVADLYNNPEKAVPTGVDNTALKLWLPMMEGAGTTAYDGSGNGNHGTISGATYVNGVGAPVSQTAVIDWNKGTNILKYSEDFTQSDWLKSAGATITSNTTIAPNGLQTADTLTLPGSGYVGISRTTNATATFSVFAKYSDTPWLFIEGFEGADKGAWFNIQTGTLGSTSGGATSTIEEAANGFYRCSITAAFAGPTTYAIFQTTGDGSFTRATGDVIIWGAQVEESATLGAYIPNPTGSELTSPVLLPQGLTSGRDITGVNLFENVRKQGALNLDGNSWAEVHDNASLDFGTGSFSLEVWSKAKYISSGSIYNVLLTLGGNVSSGSTSSIYIDSSLNYTFRYDSTLIVASGSSEGDWSHVVGVYDGTNINIYLNGSFVVQAAASATSKTNDLVKVIGRDSSGNSRAYKDQLAQPRIYNRALTAEEVQRNYNAGKNIYTN